MEKIVVIGGTNGIGRAIAERYLDQGHRVTVVGRDTRGLPPSERLDSISADLSLQSEQDKVITKLRDQVIDRLIFTAGVLTGKSTVTKEGKDAAWMVNHVARKRIATHLLGALSDNACVGFLSTWGAYKKPPAADYVYGEPGRHGLSHVMNGYVANDGFFAELAEAHPNLSVTGFYPRPTKGTQLLKRGHTPFPFNVAKLLFPIVARPLSDVAADFAAHLDNSQPGIRWFSGAKALDRPPHLTAQPVLSVVEATPV